MSTESTDAAVLQFIKPATRAMPPVGVFKVDQFQHQMQWNENPFDLPPEMKAEILQTLAQRPWSRYPGFRPYALLEHLAHFHGVDASQVVVTNGSSDAIRVTLNAVLGPGDRVVVPTPTFMLYRGYSKLQGAEVVSVPLSPDENFALPVGEIIRQARTNRAKLVVICAPNNPTGTVYSREAVRRVADESGCLVLVDEAYAHFCNQDLTPLLSEFDNVILVRTFSKAFALAGLRIGYILTSAPLAGELQKMVNTFTLNIFSEATAHAVLDHPEYMQRSTEQLVAERERMAEALDDLPGVRVYPSGTNFLLVEIDRAPQPLVDHLRTEHSLLISNMTSYPELKNHVRVSIGAPEQNQLLVRLFQEYFTS